MRLIGVGVGPGDPELVTLQAVRILRTADRVFVPVLAAPAESVESVETGRAEATVRAHAGHDRIERLVFALNERTDTGRREHYWDAAGARVAEWLTGTGGTSLFSSAPPTAAFATLGDPNVYSTFTYLAQTVVALVPAVEVSTVPGITAMQALAAASGTPLVEGTERLTLLPLAAGIGPLATTLETDGTVVVYKAGRHLPELAGAVKDAGRSAVYGGQLGLPGERVEDLALVDGAAPYLSTVLIPAHRTHRGGKL